MPVDLNLARPPIDIPRRAAAAVLLTRMRGAHLYSMGAGGFGGVPSMPQLQRLTLPANPNADHNIQLTEIYAQNPAIFKQRLANQFAPGRS